MSFFYKGQICYVVSQEHIFSLDLKSLSTLTSKRSSNLLPFACSSSWFFLSLYICSCCLWWFLFSPISISSLMFSSSEIPSLTWRNSSSSSSWKLQKISFRSCEHDFYPCYSKNNWHIKVNLVALGYNGIFTYKTPSITLLLLKIRCEVMIAAEHYTYWSQSHTMTRHFRN